MDGTILSASRLTTFYHSNLAAEERTIVLNEVSFAVHKNDIVGVVGETGAGKSILIDTVGRNLMPPLQSTAQSLVISQDGVETSIADADDETMSKVWGRGISFIPPRAREHLNPFVKVGSQFVNVIMRHSGLSRKEARQTAVDMFRRVQMPDPERNFENYPHELSGGMAQRVVISIALFLSPTLLLADEPTMGLDVTIQRQVLDILALLFAREESGAIIATRDLGIVANYCSIVLVLCNGVLVESAPVLDFFQSAHHPYSRYLLEAAFATKGMIDESQVSRYVPTKEQMGARSYDLCPFLNRCGYAKDLGTVCSESMPSAQQLSSQHHCLCHRKVV